MDNINFKLTNNKDEALSLLKEKGFKKIGHNKKECEGFCVMINRKEFFEVSLFMNPSIKVTSNISDLSHYTSCIE
jgi:hypothetical protein